MRAMHKSKKITKFALFENIHQRDLNPRRPRASPHRYTTFILTIECKSLFAVHRTVIIGDFSEKCLIDTLSANEPAGYGLYHPMQNHYFNLSNCENLCKLCL